MKKIYLSLIAAAALTTATAQRGEVTTQNSQLDISTFGKAGKMTQAAKSTSVGVSDELWYYYNKHNLRNPNNFGYPGVYSQPVGSYTATNYICKMGSAFENPGTVLISGMVGFALTNTASASPTVAVAFFLYSATGNPLLPTGAPLATFTTNVSGSSLYSEIGETITPIPVTGPYAIVMQCASTNTLDKINIAITNAKTSTATTAPANERFGERMGIVGTVAGNWFSSSNAFGAETDFEAIVTPVVDYSFSVTAAPVTPSTCNTSPMSYFNNSSGFVNHRQYNVNKLCATWAPFTNTTLLGQISPDSVFTWNFGDNTIAYGLNPTHGYTISNPTLTTVTFTDNLIGRVKSQFSPTTTSQFEISTWTETVTVCNVGLTENNISSQVGVYPNPATDKVTVYVNNVNSATAIQVLNALGQVVITRNNLTEKNELNTESLSKGIYFVRVGSGKEFTTTKLIISK